MSQIDEVRVAINQRGKAMMAADIEVVSSLLDPRCVYTHSNGLSDTKDSYLVALKKQEYTYHSVDLVSVDHAIVVGPLAILNSLMRVSMTVKSTGKSVDRQIKVTEIWTSENAPGWKLLVSHSTNKA